MVRRFRKAIAVLLGGMLLLLALVPAEARADEWPGKPWDGSLFEEPSTIYNKDLATISAWMSGEAEDGPQYISSFLLGLDFQVSNIDTERYVADGGAYVVAHTWLNCQGRNTPILIVICRGTKKLEEMIGDQFHGGSVYDAVLGTKMNNNVYEFAYGKGDEDGVWQGIDAYLDAHPEIKSSSEIKVLVTGHSLGGAAANVVAAKMTALVGRGEWLADKVSQSDIFCYTFGAINVLSDKEQSNIEDGFENIHNIYNYYDSFGPNGNWLENHGGYNVSQPECKFGHTELYAHKYDEFLLSTNTHDIWNYLKCVAGTCDGGCRVVCLSKCIARGTWGTCPWEITRDGVLTVHPGVGASQNGKWNSPWETYSDYITKVIFTEENGKKVIAPADSRCLFEMLSEVKSIDLSGIDTSNVTNMSDMFAYCVSLSSVNLSSFDTSNVMDMFAMFLNCQPLVSLDISSFDTSNVTDMGYMFACCSSLVSIDLSSFDTSNVVNMSCMFDNCTSLVSLDISSFDTSNVTDMSSMFAYCSSLATIDLTGFDTSNVTDMFGMFFDCWSLSPLDLTNFDTSSVTDMSLMFYNCSALSSLDLSSFDTSSVTKMYGMFEYCCWLKTITVGSGWSTLKVDDSNYMFEHCTSLVGGNGTKYNSSYTDKTYARIDSPGSPGYLTSASDAGSVSGTWGTCRWEIANDGVLTVHSGTGVEISSYDQYGYPISPWQEYASRIKSIVFVSENGKKVIAPSNSGYLFYQLSNVVSIDFSGFDTSDVTRMDSMFAYCWSLKTLDLSSFNTSKVTTMGDMFYSCKALVALNISSFDTSNVIMMCNMFSGCSSLKSLSINNFNTSNVAALNGMFYGCYSLSTLDLSSFDTSGATDMTQMFLDCSSLKTIIVGNGWSTKSVTYPDNHMFYGCTSLVGGNGTKFNSSHIDATYARVDKAGQPGYFTYKASAHSSGWAYENGGYYYYEADGSLRTNAWIQYGGSYYYLGADGRLVTNGWAQYGGTYYFMGSNGRVVTNGWAAYQGKWYYMGTDGRVVSNAFVKYAGKWYYVDGSGNPVVSDWVNYNGKYYYLNASGNPVTNQWVEYNGTWYHLNGSGVVDNSWKAA